MMMMMIKTVVVVLALILISPVCSYKFETCCFDEKMNNGTVPSVSLLSCPLNFMIKLRSAIFYTGNGCSTSPCQRRLNKHYLACNNHRTCSISIKCIHMDSKMCPHLSKEITHAQHLVVDYDCVLHEPEPPLVALNRLQTQVNQNQTDDQQNIVLFSAKIKIDSPTDAQNDSVASVSGLTEEERAWKEFILKQYLHGKRPTFTGNEEKPIIIHQQRSLFSDILRTVIILVVFTCILIILTLVGFILYKRFKVLRKRNLFEHHREQQQKHEPFPSDEAYDNLKTSAAGSTTDSGAATDV